MKILIIHSIFHPFLGEDRSEGGIESHTANLATCLREMGHHVTIYASSESVWANGDLLLSSQLSKTGIGRSGLKERFNTPKYVAQAMEHANEFDIVLDNSTTSYTLRHSHPRIFNFVHGFPVGIATVAVTEGLRNMNESPNHTVVTVSHYAQKWFRKKGVDSVVNMNTFLPESLVIPTRKKPKDIIITATRISQNRDLIPVITAIGENFPDFEYHLYGNFQSWHDSERAYSEEVQAIIDRYANVRHFDSAPRSELFQHYSESRLFIEPCAVHTFGLASFEAQRCGLPVLYLAKSSPDEPLPTVGMESFLRPETSVRVNTYRMGLKKKVMAITEGIRIGLSEIKGEDVLDHISNFSNDFYKSQLKELLAL